MTEIGETHDSRPVDRNVRNARHAFYVRSHDTFEAVDEMDSPRLRCAGNRHCDILGRSRSIMTENWLLKALPAHRDEAQPIAAQCAIRGRG